MIACEIGQIQGKSGTDHQGISAGFKGLFYVELIGRERLHHVDGDQTITAGNGFRAANLPVERFGIGGIHALAPIGLLSGVFSARHQVGMQATKIYGRHCADTAKLGHASCEPAG